MPKCVKCTTPLPEGANFCYKCGYPVGKVQVCRSCENCGASLSSIDKYCSQCGHSVRVVKSIDTKKIVPKIKTENIPNCIEIQKGKFFMGHASFQTSVLLLNYFISDTPITQRQYSYVMGQDPSKLKGADRPVENVSWCDALIYCNTLSSMQSLTPCYSIGSVIDLATFDQTSPIWKRVTCNFTADGYRLPSEAEWEFAARGGTNENPFHYSGSNNIEDVAWYGENSSITSHPVATKEPNSLGLYDMSGNVAEWCWDYFNPDLPSGTFTNPHGPAIGNQHVKRGGSWLDDKEQCTVLFRSGSTQNAKSSSLGFRVCRTVLGENI